MGVTLCMFGTRQGILSYGRICTFPFEVVWENLLSERIVLLKEVTGRFRAVSIAGDKSWAATANALITTNRLSTIFFIPKFAEKR